MINNIIKGLNWLLYFVTFFLNNLISSVFVPSRLTAPPEQWEVYGYYKHDFLKKLYYKDGYYWGEYLGKNKREKIPPSDIRCWSFYKPIPTYQIPKLRTAQDIQIPDILFHPKTNHVWEWVDGQGKQHWVDHNTRKALEANPYHTTLSEKRKKIEENRNNKG